jgi:hypothetical protein
MQLQTRRPSERRASSGLRCRPQRARCAPLAGRGNLIGAGKLSPLGVGVVTRHRSLGRILVFLGVGIELKRFAGAGELPPLPVWIVPRRGSLGSVLVSMGVRIVLRRLLRRRHARMAWNSAIAPPPLVTWWSLTMSASQDQRRIVHNRVSSTPPCIERLPRSRLSVVVQVKVIPGRCKASNQGAPLAHPRISGFPDAQLRT